MKFAFEVIAAKPKHESQEDEPSRTPMAPRGAGRRNPTTDQKKVRREMAKNAAVPVGSQVTVVIRYLDQRPDGKFDLDGRAVTQCPYCDKEIEASGFSGACSQALHRHVSIDHNVSAPMLPKSSGAASPSRGASMRTASSDFWDAIDAQWQKLTRAKSADDVLRILAPSEVPEETLFSGEGFFAGSGGDKSVMDALYQAGWSVVEAEADYYWCMQAPDGSQITYIEGDVYRGNRISKGGSRRTAYGLSNRFESFSPCESVQHLSADEFSAGADAGRAYYTSGRYDRGEPRTVPEGASDAWYEGFDYGMYNAQKPGWASGPD